MWKRENEEREKDRHIGMRLLRAGGEATGLLLLAKSLPLSPAIGCCCSRSINSGGIHHHLRWSQPANGKTINHALVVHIR